MSQVLPRLPLFVSNFETLRQNAAVYVDKTMYFPDLVNKSSITFCARPLRFGKSLTVSSLDAFFSGKVELFNGLAAEKYMRSPDFVSRPVVRLDMSAAANCENLRNLKKDIMDSLEQIANVYNISLRGSDYAKSFYFLLFDIRENTGLKPVLLIDEYDAPVISLAANEDERYNTKFLNRVRKVMSKFYEQIKIAEYDILHFVFITGITKYSRMGVFSSLNNLIDITLDPEFSALMGYTQEELEKYFAPFLSLTALKFGMSEDNLLDKMKDYYNGFSFDGKQLLYNPFSVLNFFDTKKFSNFWMESGSERYVRKFLSDKAITTEQYQDFGVNSSFARAPGDIETTEPHGFLYQAGYLTLREGSNFDYNLRYPNVEVRESIAKLFLKNIISQKISIDSAANELSLCMASCDIPGMVDIFYRLFAGICHKDHRDVSRSPVVRVIKKFIRKLTGSGSLGVSVQTESEDLVETLEKSRGEGFYRSLLQACLWMAGAKVTPEKPENIGDLDLEACCGRLTYVFELKMAENAGGAAVAVRNGMKQIHGRGYGLASKDPIFVSLAFGKAEKNIVGCIFEKDGKETTVEIKIKTGRGAGG
ncbi:MAG: ATP-binding protein [Deltaproteobacteria bacterium]|nr:ATP-binding protein [Deltaproteobacteria bacterium]